MAYGFIEYPTVDTVERASTSITTTEDAANYRLTFKASNNQKKGFTEGGSRTATRHAVLSVDTPTMDESGNITARATITDTSSPAKSISKQSPALSLPKVAMATPTVNVDADEEESEIIIVSINNQQTGYAEARPAPQSPPFTQSFVKLRIDGNTAIMECRDAKIERTVGASIATCTVNVTFSTNVGNCLISATTFANGAFSVFNSYTNTGTVSIPNVVCGSAISINTSYMCSLYWSGAKQDHRSLYGGTITVPSTTGTYSVEVGVVDD